MLRASFVICALTLAACSPASAPDAETPPQSTITLVADGEPAPVEAIADPNEQWAASVVRVDAVQGGAAKLYGTAGGDPAMNGLYTHIAFYQSPADGWRIFRIGDFLDYRVLSEQSGRVDLEISESTMDPQSSEIGSQTRHLIVTWTPGESAPASVSVTPARAGD